MQLKKNKKIIMMIPKMGKIIIIPTKNPKLRATVTKPAYEEQKGKRKTQTAERIIAMFVTTKELTCTKKREQY